MSRSLTAVAALVLILTLLPVTGHAPTSTADAAASKTTICHRTRSTTNPYRRISVPQSSLANASGHKNHTGPVWTAAMPNGGSWGDVIPDATAGGSNAVKANWDAAGQAVYAGTTKAGGRAACRYQSAAEFVQVMRAAGVSDADIVADLNGQAANEDKALLAALGGSFSLANIDQVGVVSATTDAATGVTTSAATLNGAVQLAAGQTAALSFRWGTTPDLTGPTTVAAATPATFTAASGDLTRRASATITGLAAGTTYYFAFVATTDAGTDTEGTLEGTIRSLQPTGSVSQSITFPQPPDAHVSSGTASVTPTASSGLPVTITTATPVVCTTSGTTVTLLAGGTCTLHADQAGDATHAPAARVSRSFRVDAPQAQTVVLDPLADQLVGSSPLVTASASSGLSVVLATVTPVVCSLSSSASGSALTLSAAGTCTVTADQPGDALHHPAPQVRASFVVSRRPQVIDLATPADVTLPADDVDVEVAATSLLTVTLTSSTPATCTVSGHRVSPRAAGTCVLQAEQGGDGTWLPAPVVERSFVVSSAPAPEPTPDVTPTPTHTVEPTPEVTPTPTHTDEPTPEVTPTPMHTVEPTYDPTPPSPTAPAPIEPATVGSPTPQTQVVTPGGGGSGGGSAGGIGGAPVSAPAPAPPPQAGPTPGAMAPPAPPGSRDADSATSGDASGSARVVAGPLSGTGHGAGGLTVARIDRPVTVTAAPGAQADAYFALVTDPTSPFGVLDVRVVAVPTVSVMWLDGDVWRKFPDAVRTEEGWGVTLTPSSTPSSRDTLVIAIGETPADRLGGPGRIQTAVLVSQVAHPADGSAPAAVLARDDVFADALTGGPLAAAVQGPLLLTPTTGLSAATATELQRVLPAGGTVYLLGGTLALSSTVADDVEALGFVVVRIAGRDRFGTAVAIAERLGDPHVIFTASGRDFPDAMAAGPAAISTGGAVLLTEGRQPDPTTQAYLDRWAAAGHTDGIRYAVGGDAVAADPTAVPLAGTDRQDTTAIVAETFFAAPTGVGLAAGGDFPDALVAVPLLGRTGRPLLLVGSGSLAPRAQAYLRDRSAGISRVDVFGGTAAVSDEVVREVQRALP